jgi:hypothetical protein
MIYQKIISLFNIIFFNFLIIFLKFVKGKKIILFYHPRKHLTNIHTDYVERLFNKSNKNIIAFYGHEVLGLSKKDYFFLRQGAIKYIFNIDIFLSNNVCDVFPKKAKKIYIHHDIYDSILISNSKEVELFKRIMKYDYLFLSNKKTILFFNNFLNKNKKILKNISLPKIFETGYFKLDHLRNIITKRKKIENNIVIAITDFNHVPKLSLIKDLKNLINFFILNTNYKVYLRPYPRNRTSNKILKIIKEFSGNDKFELDLSENYYKLYSNTKFLITDISGTAYTYAFFTKKPVIFFSRNEKLLKRYKFNVLNYFIDREKIGLIVKNYKELAKAVKKIDTNKQLLLNSNKRLLSEMTYIDKSKSRINFLLNMLINNKL